MLSRRPSRGHLSLLAPRLSTSRIQGNDQPRIPILCSRRCVRNRILILLNSDFGGNPEAPPSSQQFPTWALTLILSSSKSSRKHFRVSSKKLIFQSALVCCFLCFYYYPPLIGIHDEGTMVLSKAGKILFLLRMRHTLPKCALLKSLEQHNH